MRFGRRVALDVGRARIGIAYSDEHAILSTPQPHILRSPSSSQLLANQLNGLENILEIYIGLPLNLKSKETESTSDCIGFARELQLLVKVDVLLIDERFSTKIASQIFHSLGISTKSQRTIIDSAAASVILESALDLEQSSGHQPGIAVSEYVD